MKKLFNPVDCVVTDALAGKVGLGFSITVRALTPELTRLWDAPVDTPGLRWGR
jgi:dihydroxyacetone kinase-like protein